MKVRNIAYLLSSLFIFNTHYTYAFDINPALLISGFGNAGASMNSATEVDFYNPLTFQKTPQSPTRSEIAHELIFNGDTLAGLQLVAKLNDEFSFTSQFVSIGQLQYALETEWLYAEWRPNDVWDIKVGRNIMPLFMHSAYLQVNYAYPWARLPYDFYLYTQQLSDMDGVTITHTVPVVGNWWNSVTASFGKAGSNAIDAADTFDLEKIMSFEVALYNDNSKLRIGYFQARVDVNLGQTGALIQETLNDPCAVFFNQLDPSQITITPSLEGPPACQIVSIASPLPFDPITQGFVQPDSATAALFNTTNVPTKIYSAGYEFTWNHIVGMTEWNMIKFSDDLLPSSTSWYVLLGYTWDNFTPYVTVSTFRTTNDNKRVLNDTISGTYVNPFSYFGPVGSQPVTLEDSISQVMALASTGDETTLEGGIRYDIASKVALKVEYRYIIPRRGTVGLFDIAPGKRVSEVTALVAFVY